MLQAGNHFTDSLEEYVTYEINQHAKRLEKNDWTRWPNMQRVLYEKGEYMTLYVRIPNHPRGWGRIYYIIFDHFDFEMNYIVGREIELPEGKYLGNCDYEKDVMPGRPVVIEFKLVYKWYNCIFLGPDM